MYREFAPPAQLAGVAVCAWRYDLRGAPEDRVQRVLPDGCVDLVWTAGRPPVLAGPDTGPVLARLPAGSTTVGLRLAPGAAGPALGVPASELRNARVSLEEVWPGWSAQLNAEEAGVDPLGALLAAAHPRLDGAGPDPVIPAAIRMLGRPGFQVRSVASDLGFSERHLHRRFLAAVGYGPKMLHRVLRLRRFLAEAATAREQDRVSLAGLAVAAGYADQAHLSNECQRLAGLAPAALLRSWR